MLYSINSLVLVSVFVGQRFDDAVFLYDSISLLWLKRFKNEGGVLFLLDTVATKKNLFSIVMVDF